MIGVLSAAAPTGPETSLSLPAPGFDADGNLAAVLPRQPRTVRDTGLDARLVTALLSALGGCATGLAVLLPFYLLRGMAAGDVKMMAAVGVFTGAGDALRIAILAWCAGGVMVLVVLIVRGRLRLALANLWAMLLPILLRLQRLPSPSQDSGGRPSAGSIPYGVAIAAGTIVHLVGRYGATPLA